MPHSVAETTEVTTHWVDPDFVIQTASTSFRNITNWCKTENSLIWLWGQPKLTGLGSLSGHGGAGPFEEKAARNRRRITWQSSSM